MSLLDELNTACDIAREAGRVVLSYAHSGQMGARAKGDRDVVTEADTASERIVLQRVREAFPGDGLVAEEGSEEAARSTRRWYVDPLDGTVNFSRGLPIWCVVLTLFDGDQPVLGVIHDPIREVTFRGVTGEGVWMGNQRLSTSEVVSLEDAFIHLTIDFNEASLHAGLEDIQVLAPRVLRTRNIGSAALALAYVAAGHFDAMIHRYANPWDYGAGVLFVREAGGVVTGLDGSPYTVHSRAVLATGTEALHADLSALIQDVATPHVE